MITTRFNENTWKENKKYRIKHNFACIYGSPCKISEDILFNSFLFVIEMNNDTNQIEGIGLIKNMTINDKYYKIYSVGNYNRYVYIGNYYLDRESIYDYNFALVLLLEILLFKGKNHLKRGSGFTTLSDKILNKINSKNKIIGKEFTNEAKKQIIIKEISKCFKYYFGRKTMNNKNE